LREHDLVKTRRDAKTIFYSLNEPVVDRYLDQILSKGMMQAVVEQGAS